MDIIPINSPFELITPPPEDPGATGIVKVGRCKRLDRTKTSNHRWYVSNSILFILVGNCKFLSKGKIWADGNAKKSKFPNIESIWLKHF